LQEAHPTGALALIICLDQLPRRLFHGTPDAYHSDSEAHRVCMQLIEREQDLQFGAFERYFAYMPLKHAESLETQHVSVASFERLAKDYPSCEFIAKGVESAHAHHALIVEHGRFPHRDQALGRKFPSKQGTE
jgi:uncharacterized protein (DUF924 family)